jgi:hypothetical protein
MHLDVSRQAREEVLQRWRRRYAQAGKQHKGKLLDEAVALFGYHRKAAIRVLGGTTSPKQVPAVLGRPAKYDPEKLLPVLKVIWLSSQQPCGKLLRAALPEWVPAYEQDHRRLDADVRRGLLEASAATLDRLLAPLRVKYRRGPGGTKPGSLLRQEIPIRGSLWEENKPGWLEVDTVALCGGRLDDEHAWMLDGVDICTSWVEVRALADRSQHSTLEQLKDIEARLPFALLGLDSDNGGEFLNRHVVRWCQQRTRPVYLTRARPYHKDDNAHVEQKNWTHVRQWFGYERYDNPAVVPLINELTRGAWGQLVNFFCPTMKLERKERVGSRIKRVYGPAQTPYARVLASNHVSEQSKRKLGELKSRLNPLALARQVERELKTIYTERTGGS